MFTDITIITSNLIQTCNNTKTENELKLEYQKEGQNKETDGMNDTNNRTLEGK